MARRATEGDEALCGRADAHVRAGPPGPAKAEPGAGPWVRRPAPPDVLQPRATWRGAPPKGMKNRPGGEDAANEWERRGRSCKGVDRGNHSPQIGQAPVGPIGDHPPKKAKAVTKEREI
jgi:hypothetical protein